MLAIHPTRAAVEGTEPSQTTTHGALCTGLIGSGWDAAPAGPEAAARSATAAALLPEHLRELVAGSGIAPLVAELNCRSFGPGAAEHWETARAELIAHKRLAIQTTSTTESGLPQAQPGFLAGRLIGLQQTYSHLAEGGWRSTTAGLPGFEPFDCLKPAAPRLSSDRKFDKRTGLVVPTTPKPVKYETPPGAPGGGGVFAPMVPVEQWRTIAGHADLPLPAGAEPGGFWPWALEHRHLPVVLTEGLKKCLSIASHGHAALGLPGITMGWRTDDNGHRRLIPELEAIAAKGRPVVIAFDAEGKRRTARKVITAARTLARLLEKAGCVVRIAEMPLLPGASKVGADDLVVARGPAALAEVIAAARPISALPVLAHLRPADLVVPDRYLPSDALTVAGMRRLIALASAMGTGKSTVIANHVAPLLRAGVPVVLITHRQSLGAALAAELGLPWGDDAAPGSDLRQQGLALCVDSLCPGSRLRFRAADWTDAVVVIDEARQVLHHALNGSTAIAARRPAVLAELAALLAGASQVLVADAQLDDATLEAFEACVGERAYLIASEHKPAAGRDLVVHASRESWRAELEAQVQAGRRLWVSTTAQKPDSPNAAASLAALVAELRPDARVLVVDSETVDDPDHDAHRLAAEPDRIAAAYDVVVTTPAVQAGLSVTVPFDAVFAIAGGNTPPAGVVQSLARVRCDAPRHLYAPTRAPGASLTVGCGAFEADRVVRSLDRHCQALVGALVAAGGWSPTAPTAGPWVALWARMAAHQNAEAQAFGATAVALLAREGYHVVQRAPLAPVEMATAKATTARLKLISETAQADADARLIAAPVLDDDAARKLQRRRRLSPADRAALARWRIARRWGLGDAPPTPQLLEADRDGAADRHRMQWLLQAPDAADLVQHHDTAVARALAPRGEAWGPDLAARTLGPKLQALVGLGIGEWLERPGEFSADDPVLLTLQATATVCADDLRQVLGIRPGERATTTLRRLLSLVGARLEARRHRGRDDDRDRWRYRVVLDDLPTGIDPNRLREAWRHGLQHPELT